MEEDTLFDQAYMLLPHKRCGAHTINLVAIKGAEVAFEMLLSFQIIQFGALTITQ